MQACPTRYRLQETSSVRRILSPEYSLVVEPRQMSEALIEEAGHYLTDGPGLVMARGSLPEVTAQFETACTAKASLLVSDIISLAKLYSEVSGHKALRVRLERITTDKCRKFHVDYIDLRLLRTYVGPGVQWTADEGNSVSEAEAGDVVFLKGKHFPGWENADRILHRSPPLSIRPSEERVRLLLTIDEASACGDAPSTMVA